MKEFFAHSVEGRPPEEWHSLEEHLRNVAELAKKFGDEFGSGDWVYLAGMSVAMKLHRKVFKHVS